MPKSKKSKKDKSVADIPAAKHSCLNELINCWLMPDKDGDTTLHPEWVNLSRLLRVHAVRGHVVSDRAKLYAIRNLTEMKVNGCMDFFKFSKGWGRIYMCVCVSTVPSDKYVHGETELWPLDAQHRIEALRRLTAAKEEGTAGYVFTLANTAVQTTILKYETPPDICQLISRLLNFEGGLASSENLVDICFWLNSCFALRKLAGLPSDAAAMWAEMEQNHMMKNTMTFIHTSSRMGDLVRLVAALKPEGIALISHLQEIDEEKLFEVHMKRMSTNTLTIEGGIPDETVPGVKLADLLSRPPLSETFKHAVGRETSCYLPLPSSPGFTPLRVAMPKDRCWDVAMQHSWARWVLDAGNHLPKNEWAAITGSLSLFSPSDKEKPDFGEILEAGRKVHETIQQDAQTVKFLLDEVDALQGENAVNADEWEQMQLLLRLYTYGAERELLQDLLDKCQMKWPQLNFSKEEMCLTGMKSYRTKTRQVKALCEVRFADAKIRNKKTQSNKHESVCLEKLAELAPAQNQPQPEDPVEEFCAAAAIEEEEDGFIEGLHDVALLRRKVHQCLDRCTSTQDWLAEVTLADDHRDIVSKLCPGMLIELEKADYNKWPGAGASLPVERFADVMLNKLEESASGQANPTRAATQEYVASVTALFSHYSWTREHAIAVEAVNRTQEALMDAYTDYRAAEVEVRLQNPLFEYPPFAEQKWWDDNTATCSWSESSLGLSEEQLEKTRPIKALKKLAIDIQSRREQELHEVLKAKVLKQQQTSSKRPSEFFKECVVLGDLKSRFVHMTAKVQEETEKFANFHRLAEATTLVRWTREQQELVRTTPYKAIQWENPGPLKSCDIFSFPAIQDAIDLCQAVETGIATRIGKTTDGVLDGDRYDGDDHATAADGDD